MAFLTSSIARQRGKAGFLIVETNAQVVMDNLRNELGQWEKSNRAAEANKLLAKELATLVAAEQQKSLIRRRVSSGRLKDALLDERNRKSNNSSFSVGVVSFLNKSDAKYWRQIDQGTNIHVGRFVGYGMWGSTVRGVTGPGRVWGEMYDKAIGPFSYGSGSAREGEVAPTGVQRWRPARKDAMANWRSKGLAPGVLKISNPIQAQRYFERGWNKFDKHEAAVRIIKKVRVRKTRAR